MEQIFSNSKSMCITSPQQCNRSLEKREWARNLKTQMQAYERVLTSTANNLHTHTHTSAVTPIPLVRCIQLELRKGERINAAIIVHVIFYSVLIWFVCGKRRTRQNGVCWNVLHFDSDWTFVVFAARELNRFVHICRDKQNFLIFSLQTRLRVLLRFVMRGFTIRS